MLAARKSSFLNALLYRVLMLSAVQGAFHSVYVRQASPPPPANDRVLLYANHCSWWDGHMAMILNECLWHRDAHIMVEDTQLERYQFFRYLGAFSVNRQSPRAAALSLRYAGELLKAAPNRLLLIFPQGQIQANDVRPLRFFTGVGHIAHNAASCLAYPLALRLEFIGEQKPEAFLSIGQPLAVETPAPPAKELTHRMQTALEAELDQLRADIIAREFSTFTPLVKGAWSINRVWDAVRGKPQIKPLGPV
jgi:1-acyl-sn-glycerol-3-phosphate acyltransferase